MKLALLGLLGIFSVAAQADFESIPYTCRCTCFDYQLRPVRYRVPGGQATEYMHKPLFNPRFNNYNATVDFLIPGQTPDSCRRIHGYRCEGTQEAPQFNPTRVPGWLSRCYWDINPYPENP